MKSFKYLCLVVLSVAILFVSSCSDDDSDNQADLALIADFSTNLNSIRPGQTVQFEDKSTGEVVSYEWSFEGGTPNSSTQQNPIIKYEIEGNFSVTLKISNEINEDIEVKTGYISVARSSENELLSLTFEANLNAQINTNINTTITDNKVTGYIPFGTSYQLTPTFNLSDFATIKIGDLAVVSGETLIDFSSITALTVVAENGDENIYEINIIDGFPSLDQAIENIMSSYNIPGVQIGILKDEKLVYARPYGLANVEDNTPITNESLFRIASISKPITAIGILSLIEDGIIDFDDKVFGEGAILGTTYGTTPYNDQIEAITVRHLLDHKAGGWTNDENDPMFLPNSWSQGDIIDYVLDNRPLDYTPGSTYLYSNFGYCLLGRVIEAASGMAYADFIQNQILNPSTISAMKISKNTFDERYENEVKYYNNSTSWSPYSPNVERMDSHGGWIASSTDLLKFMARIDRNTSIDDILSEPTLNSMYFGYFNWYHSGALPGTSTVLSRLNNEFSFAVLSNGNSSPFGDSIDDLVEALTNEINNRTSWPDYDLFEE